MPDPVEKAQETITIPKWKLAVLVAGAATSVIAHGAEAVGKLLGLF